MKSKPLLARTKSIDDRQDNITNVSWASIELSDLDYFGCIFSIFPRFSHKFFFQLRRNVTHYLRACFIDFQSTRPFSTDLRRLEICETSRLLIRFDILQDV